MAGDRKDQDIGCRKHSRLTLENAGRLGPFHSPDYETTAKQSRKGRRNLKASPARTKFCLIYRTQDEQSKALRFERSRTEYKKGQNKDKEQPNKEHDI
jgi:hypothetical protein